ncbi:MAG: aldehyde dehydrogenase family protein [Deltaproteobacteria bacterium]|nr:aldehyde dehydrogenase family protein [Deltaproteobacteria bacterium]
MSTNPAAQASSAVARARAAQPAWAALAVTERAKRLRAAGLAILLRAEELAQLIVTETHKPLAEAYSSEVLGVGDLVAYWCKHGPGQLAPRKGLVPALELPGKKAVVHRVPRGVVACISPWNYPVSLPMRTIVPALLGGNAVVLKPSEITPRSGAWLVQALHARLGDVVTLLEGDGAAGAALVEAGPDLVVFTGSTRTGRKVAVACAERGIPCELELGGKDCAIVLDDCAVDRTAQGVAWGILTNAGQNCSGIERVAVHQGIAHVFVPKLVAAMEKAARDVPELVTPAQRAIVERHVQDALGRGAVLLTGRIDATDRPLPPLLLARVPADAPAWCDESFGPVAVLVQGADDAELVALANDSRYGLGASVWSGNADRADALAAQLRCGMVWINNHSFSGALPDLPWTGVGDSGTGVTNSPDALAHMTRPRLVVADGNRKPEPWWYPYGDKLVELMRVLVARQQSGGVGATVKTLRALRARMAELSK